MFVLSSADHTQLIDTIETVPAWRRSATNGTMMTSAESSTGRPPALLQWFYPGMRDGHTFIYSARTERKLEAAEDGYVVSNTRAPGWQPTPAETKRAQPCRIGCPRCFKLIYGGAIKSTCKS